MQFVSKFLEAVVELRQHPATSLSLPHNAEETFLRLLTPTGNKRFNELIGFLCITLAILIALALLSYSPKDAAFNVSASENAPTQNWIGPVGAYGSDGLFQIFGFAAFLLPAAILVLGWRWLRSPAVDSQLASWWGFACPLPSLPPPLSLLPHWDLPA